jgi:HlyD family secretion protein
MVWAVVTILALLLWRQFGFASVQAKSSVTASLQMAAAQATITNTTVSAVGQIELMRSRPIVLQVSGMVDEAAVEVGDSVAEGDLLLALDTEPLELAVKNAEIGLEQTQIGLEQAKEGIQESDVAAAEAQVLLAKETLALVQAGPTKEELAAAQSAATAAWEAYNDLKAGPSKAQQDVAKAGLQQAAIDLQEAKRAYDSVAWRADVAMTPESSALQRATIAYEAAKANLELANQPAKESQLQAAISAAQSAQNQLNQLKKKPTPAELAQAQANLATAEAALAKLKLGVKASTVRNAQLAVDQAQMALDQAKRDLGHARLSAPISGTVLSLNAEVGQALSAGTTAAVLADITKLKLVVNVEQRVISQIKVGQKVLISVYGLGDRSIGGVVERIAPSGQQGVNAVVFPVTIRINEDSLAGLLPGMAATAVFER